MTMTDLRKTLLIFVLLYTVLLLQKFFYRKMSFSATTVELPALPYAYTALEPYIGEQTLVIHHDRHHAKYVATTKELIQGTDLQDADLITILRSANGSKPALFNNAAQSYNHAFYWESMKPAGGGVPTGRIAALIDASFGSFANFRTEFINAGLTAFGSGWAWLVWTPTGLKITKTIGAGNPLTEEGQVPLLTMDVWEHAYYLNYQNNRAGYEENFVDHLINWDFVERQLPTEA